MRPTKPLWSVVELVSGTSQPIDFRVSLEDMVPGTGKLVDGPLAVYDSPGVRFRPGDVLFGKLRPYLCKHWLCDRDGTAGGDIHVYRPLVGNEPRFIDYVVGMADFARYAEAVSKGTKMPRAEWSSLGEFPTPSWGIADQRRIVDYLDRETSEIDAMISEQERLVRALREHAEAIYERGVFGLDAGDSLDSAGHPMFVGTPSHWAHSRFGAEFIESSELNGQAPIGPLLSISEYRGVEVNERTQGQRASETVEHYRVLRVGQLAANMMWLNHGGIGVSGVDGYISPDYRAYDISERFLPGYVHYLMRSRRYIGYFTAIGNGVRPNAQRVTKTSLDMAPIPVPPLDEQQAIVSRLEDASCRIDATVAEASRLKDLLLERRAALITEVITGRKDVV